jgi:hypothetical protein
VSGRKCSRKDSGLTRVVVKLGRIGLPGRQRWDSRADDCPRRAGNRERSRKGCPRRKRRSHKCATFERTVRTDGNVQISRNANARQEIRDKV